MKTIADSRPKWAKCIPAFRLQNSPYLCVFKYARAVKQKVVNEAENRERDWGERKKNRLFCSLPVFRLTRRKNYTGQCKTQTADYCFHHANENVTTIVPLFSNPKNNSPQSVRSLHSLHCPKTIPFGAAHTIPIYSEGVPLTHQ